ncbi:MAG: 23S rRNA (guanosine(2251)-2'-O)-methyltransferase RlmB [Syntrophomonadaceae bacterium]|nr:23S rRNA (guanosine(2251)-2'-O)-methyltransferase RlmB [Syntrophomonadaceae bacterium]
MQEKLAGVNSIMEALRGKRKVHKIYVQEGRGGKRIEELLRFAQKKGVFWQYVDKQRLDAMYAISNHQGIVAQVDTFAYSSLDEILEQAALQGKEPFILMLDGIEDPQNLGSIIRTAECAGIDGVVIPRHSSAEITAAVARASAGAVEHMPIARETNLVNCIKQLQEKGLWIVGADMDGKEYFECQIPRPTALVIGGEGKGIRKLVRQNCDMLVSIPMMGLISSLNASVAAGLVIYEAVRQKRSADKQIGGRKK